MLLRKNQRHGKVKVLLLESIRKGEMKLENVNLFSLTKGLSVGECCIILVTLLTFCLHKNKKINPIRINVKHNFYSKCV